MENKGKLKVVGLLVLLLIAVLALVKFRTLSTSTKKFREIAPKVTAAEEFNYLFLFNGYPRLDLSRAENITIAVSPTNKQERVATFQYKSEFFNTQTFIQSYLAQNKFTNISYEPSGADKATLKARTVGGKPLAMTVTKGSKESTTVSLTFMASITTRAPLATPETTK